MCTFLCLLGLDKQQKCTHPTDKLHVSAVLFSSHHTRTHSNSRQPAGERSTFPCACAWRGGACGTLTRAHCTRANVPHWPQQALPKKQCAHTLGSFACVPTPDFLQHCAGAQPPFAPSEPRARTHARTRRAHPPSSPAPVMASVTSARAPSVDAWYPSCLLPAHIETSPLHLQARAHTHTHTLCPPLAPNSPLVACWTRCSRAVLPVLLCADLPPHDSQPRSPTLHAHTRARPCALASNAPTQHISRPTATSFPRAPRK
jgi:hypothetical protein